MGKIKSARVLAVEVLYQVNEQGGFANILLPKLLAQGTLSHKDRAFTTELVYGTLRWQQKLDWIISLFSKRPLDKLDPWVRNILRLGVYQLFYLQRIPPRAACYETVQLAKYYSHQGSAAFVNGILRNILRRRQEITFPDPASDPVEYLAVVYSHPRWLVQRWLARLGFAETEKLLQANNTARPLTIRVNTLKTTAAELCSILTHEGLAVRPGRYFAEALVLEQLPAVNKLASFQDGLFIVQDEASMLPARILAPQANERILDACAAPGGKTTHIAQLMGDCGNIIAGDIHPHKLELVRSNCTRLGITSVDVKEKDAREWACTGGERFHRVLVDAPCSGTGVLNRRPDARWRRTPEQLLELPILQRKILQAVASCVLPGGVLVYSTCSLEAEENNKVIEAFLEENPDFQLDDLTPYIPSGLAEPLAQQGFLQVYPHRQQIDGFFVARMVRRQ
ncbi:MAG: 16S rRNA (cytosine(967)-C(5))-methyltransferase RsmB [bacterium]|jgi:16S rRNA (cytosine967-C5)-methyltransferase